MKYTLYIGTNKYSLSTEDDILKLSPGNFECQYKILIGNTDILKSVQVAYRKLFKKSIEKYNKNNPKKEIKSYYCKINESQKQSLAVGILIKINEKNYKNLDEEKIYAMRLRKTVDDVLIDEFNEDYAFTQKEGKSETIERFIKDKYEGKGPILVGGDALGDESMLTKFKDTEVLLIMKREGKLDNLVNDERALIQKRNAQTGLLDPKN